MTDIITDPDQPRKYMDPDALAASIAHPGVLELLLFRVDGNREQAAPGNPD